MATLRQALKMIRAKAKPDQLAGMARFGIVGEGRLGLSVPDMRQIAKELGKDHALAVEVWRTGIPDARIVAALIDDPRQVTEAQMDEWVVGLNSWDVCDQVCLTLFDKTPFAWKKVVDWSEREEEFVKRAAFALLAGLAWHDKSAPDEKFVELLPVIKDAATDDRNFVKKAVNWALRHIGKRNAKLNKAAIRTAKDIQKIDSKTARWIASDAIRELTSDAVQNRF